jgi:hypothetical protein
MNFQGLQPEFGLRSDESEDVGVFEGISALILMVRNAEVS